MYQKYTKMQQKKRGGNRKNHVDFAQYLFFYLDFKRLKLAKTCFLRVQWLCFVEIVKQNKIIDGLNEIERGDGGWRWARDSTQSNFFIYHILWEGQIKNVLKKIIMLKCAAKIFGGAPICLEKSSADQLIVISLLGKLRIYLQKLKGER